MRKYLTIIFLALALPLGAQPLDSARTARLDGLMAQYFTLLAGEPAAVQGAEMDGLISSCRDSLLRQYVALRIYGHYIGSKVMGDESVAIGIFDRWFAPGKVRFKTEIDRMNAQVFADFNRSSLIGMRAPELVLQDINGLPVDPTAASKGRYAVLYFYDTDCSSCRIESARLREFVSSNTYPIDIYAIYTGSDEAAWARYRALNLPGGVTHLWDPGLASDFPRKYGVIQTPRMFLLAPDGTVAGRGLDTGALKILLDKAFAPEETYAYGSAASRALFDALFAEEDGSADAVARVAGYVASTTLEKGDSLNYRHLCGDLLHYLSTAEGPGMKEGTRRFIRERILPGGMDPEVAALGGLLDDLLSKTPAGEKLPALTLHGTFHARRFLCGRKAREGAWRIDRLRKPALLVFYAPGCSRCEELLARVGTMEEAALLVDMDALFSDHPDEANAALGAFDLTVLPFVVRVDRKGVVLEKYLRVSDL